MSLESLNSSLLLGCFPVVKTKQLKISKRDKAIADAGRARINHISKMVDEGDYSTCRVIWSAPTIVRPVSSDSSLNLSVLEGQDGKLSPQLGSPRARRWPLPLTPAESRRVNARASVLSMTSYENDSDDEDLPPSKPERPRDSAVARAIAEFGNGDSVYEEMSDFPPSKPVRPRDSAVARAIAELENHDCVYEEIGELPPSKPERPRDSAVARFLAEFGSVDSVYEEMSDFPPPKPPRAKCKVKVHSQSVIISGSRESSVELRINEKEDGDSEDERVETVELTELFIRESDLED